MDRFVVVAHHHDGTKLITTPFLDTFSPSDAVSAAQNAEDFGYSLSAVGAGVEVLRLRDGVVFKRSRFDLNDLTPPKGHPIVYRRIIKDDAWHDEFFDERVRAACQTPAKT